MNWQWQKRNSNVQPELDAEAIWITVFALLLSFPFVLLNKPLLPIPREKKKTFNLSDICETEGSVRPSRNTVDM